MYSTLKNVQYLIAMLKERNIINIVISPGNSHNAIVRSMEEDTFFKTYSIVDERSAAFFAIGLIQELNEPVAICCTSGTATTNYLSGVTEAARRNLPLIIITADKNQYYLDQYTDQMINQLTEFKPIVKYQANLPMIKDYKDEWYCNRILNEAFLEMNHHGVGPIHINVPIEEGMHAIDKYFGAVELPKVSIINRYDCLTESKIFKDIFEGIKDKKVLIIYGQDYVIDTQTRDAFKKISNQYNCVIGVDILSNFHEEYCIDLSRASLVASVNSELGILMPDIIIMLAGNSITPGKYNYLSKKDCFETWIVNEDGKVHDFYKNLKKVFEMPTKVFAEFMANFKASNNQTYRNNWIKETKKFVLPNFEYSNLYATNKLMNMMPSNSVLNIANSTTIRIAEYFDIDDSIKIYCNRGVNGIDGCMSTFMGTSAATDKLSFIIVGDLTFFYDMNSLWNRYRSKNIRIMLVNNAGASLFHFGQSLKKYPRLNENVAAEHFTTAKGWVEDQGFEYLSAKNKKEFDDNIIKFISDKSKKGIVLEVFTNKEEDAKLYHSFYNAQLHPTGEVKRKAKSIIKKAIGRL